MKQQIIWVFLLAGFSLAGQVSSNHLIRNSKKNAISQAGISNTTTAPPDIFILGSGGFKNLFSGEGNSNSPLTGSIAVSFLTAKSETTIGFTINSLKVIDVSTPELFGANMLNPDLGGLSFSLNHMRILPRSNDKFGINGVLQLSNSKWQLDTNYLVQANPVVFKFSAVFAPWGKLFQPGSTSENDNFITAYFSVGYSLRALTGNIAHKDFRIPYFGTKKTFFSGLEFGGNLVINNTLVFVNVPVLFSKDKIDNLTGMQIVIGVVVGGDVLAFKGS